MPATIKFFTDSHGPNIFKTVLRRQAYRFELRPSGQQLCNLRQFAGSCRFVYNKNEKRLVFAGLCGLLPNWKKEHPFLSEVPAQALQQALKNLERAYGEVRKPEMRAVSQCGFHQCGKYRRGGTRLASAWGTSPLKGSNMKRLFALAILLLGSVGVARAQLSAPALNSDGGNAAPGSAASSAIKAALPSDLLNPFARPAVTTALALPLENAEPASPSPRPKFLYGGRDDYRWQLGISASWLHFRSSAFTSNATGINTSVVYFTNDWFGVEGNITAVFAPAIFSNEHVKIGMYGAGPKIALRKRQWEPWLHLIFGGAQERPQIAGQSRASYVIKGGGGGDYRWNPRLSFRLEGDYVRTGFFKQSQNSFQLAGGIVFHF